MGAGHAHSPAADDAGHPGDFRTKLAIAFTITAGIVVAQAVGAWVTGSLALLTDTAHALTDASGLLVALGAGFAIAARVLSGYAADRRQGRNFPVVAGQLVIGAAGLILLAVGPIPTPGSKTSHIEACLDGTGHGAAGLA